MEERLVNPEFDESETDIVALKRADAARGSTLWFTLFVSDLVDQPVNYEGGAYQES